MARGKSIKKKEWPCGYCEKNCNSYCVYCDSCEKWFHSACQNLDETQLQRFGEIEEGFICIVCRCDNDGKFDYLMGLSRLSKAARAGIDTLKSVAERENMICGDSFTVIRADPKDLVLDVVADQMRARNTTDNHSRAAQSSADGDCLFNAVSTCLVGTENMSLELRFRTCLELVLNPGIQKHPSRAAFVLLSPAYASACVDCAKVGGYSSVWTILALSCVIKTPIRAFYPNINGCKDLAFVKLNELFHPTETTPETHPICIMWTSTLAPQPGKTWTPNHFVPLVVASSIKKSVSEQSFVNGHVGGTSTPVKRRSSLNSNSPTFCKKPRMDSSSSFTSPNRFTVLDTDDDADERMNEDTGDDTPAPIPERIHPLPGTKPMDPQTLLSVVAGSMSPSQSIPTGKKEDVFVVLDNEDNIKKTLSGKAANYPDDCGVWDSKRGHTVRTKFVATDDTKLKYVVEKNGLFHTEKQVQGKKTYVLLSPQPATDTIVTLHRYYTCLKRDTSFKKRVSWFHGHPIEKYGHRKFLAIVEYVGKYPIHDTAHGNAKHSKDAYLRTDPNILDKIKTQVTNDKPTNVYTKMTKLDDSTCYPRDLKQVQNCKQSTKQKTSYRSNVADELLQVISMINNHDFVAEIIHSRNQGPPVIICYTDQQISDLRSFLQTESGVVGIDRTFNLGKCYVTTLVYKSNKVNRKTTGQPPILLGPVLLHWDGQTKTYHHFFSHLRGILDLNLKNFEMWIGTDEEKAMTKAIDMNFPGSNRKLCTKHIKDNIRRFLTDKSPTDVKTRQHIIDQIFGANGLTSADDTFDFDQRTAAFTSDLTNHGDFIDYFERHIKDKLLKHVLNDNTDELWTNNNAESMNNRIKLACDWKPLKTDELIERLYDIVRTQTTDLRRSLYGSGNFTLNSKFQKFKLSPTVWNVKSMEEKNIYFEKFLKYTTAKKTKIVTSTNGLYSVTRPQTLAKKPHQKKRAKSCKTQKRH